jgi:prevent-host-death family protein
MTSVSIHEAKTHLSRLIARVALGEESVIAKGGRPVARLVPFRGQKGRREPGLDQDTVRIAEDFDGPLPEELLRESER